MPAASVDTSGVEQFVAREVERSRQRADQIAGLEADNHLARLETDLRIDALKRRGKDAFGATAEIEDAWLKGVSEIEKNTAKTERQRAVLKARASGRWAQLYETVERHAASEARRYDDDTTKAALNTRVNDATAHYNDPKSVALALLEATAIVRDYADRNGLSPEVRDEQLKETVSAIHTGVLNRMLSAGDDRSAAAYYEKAKGEIQGDDAAKIERALQVSNTLAAAQRETDVIMSTEDITRDQAFAKARTIDDPEIRKETEQMLDVEFSRRDRAERDLSESRFKQAFDYANDGRRPPVPLWNSLSPGQQVSIDERIRQMARGASGGGGASGGEEDWGLYHDLKSRAATHPDEFAKVNLLEARPYLGDTEWKELFNLQLKIRSGDGLTLRSFQTSGQIVEQHVGDLFPNAGKKGSEDRKRAIAFRKEVGDAEIAWKKAHKSEEIPEDEFRRIVEEKAVRNVFVERQAQRPIRGFGAIPTFPLPTIGGDREKELTEVEEDERGRAYVPYESIPDASREQIENELRARYGRIRSRRQVERIFAAQRSGDRALANSIMREGTGGGAEF